MNPVHKPSAALVVVRVVIITVLLTLLSFVVALFFGTVGILLANIAHGGGINMTVAYRDIAFPIAIVIGAAVMVIALVSEVRRYRRARATTVEALRRAA